MDEEEKNDVTESMVLIERLLQNVPLTEKDRQIKNNAILTVAKAINDPDGYCKVEEG